LQARDVIAVLVRDQDRGKRLRIGADGLQALEGFLAREAGVDQQARPLGGNQGAVAGTRGRKNRDFENRTPPTSLEPETG
jgi:hypothetical protein